MIHEQLEGKIWDVNIPGNLLPDENSLKFDLQNPWVLFRHGLLVLCAGMHGIRSFDSALVWFYKKKRKRLGNRTLKAKLSCNLHSRSLCHICPMVVNLAWNLDLYGQVVWWVYKRFRSSEGFCGQGRLLCARAANLWLADFWKAGSHHNARCLAKVENLPSNVATLMSIC